MRAIATGRIIALAGMFAALCAPPLFAQTRTLNGGVSTDVYSGAAATGSNPLSGGTTANPPGRDVYCQQSPGMPMYGPYHGTGTQTPCGPAFQRQSAQPPPQQQQQQQQQQQPISGCWTKMPEGKLCVENGVFREWRGNVVILRGVNLAGTSKTPPFLPLPASFAPPPNLKNMDVSNFDFLRNSDLSPIARMPRLGFNVIRLIFVWEAYEPVEGQRNPAYVAMLRAIIQEAWRHHIYTIVDFHQDGFARFLADGCGEGFPYWTIPQFPAWLVAAGKGKPDKPDNSAACKAWMQKAFLDPKVHLSFHALYHSALIQKYMALADELVSQLCGERGVIGFDPLNEPFSDPTSWDPTFASDVQSRSFLDKLFPDVFTNSRMVERELTGFYQAVANLPAVRRTKTILFLEPNLLVDTGITTTLQRPQNYDQIVYAPHYYDPDTTAIFGAFGLPTRTENAFQNMQAVAKQWNVPLFLGEFGALINTGRVQAYMNALHDGLNRTLASAAQWSFTPGWTPDQKDGWNGEDLSIIAPVQIRPQLFRARPYPQETAGVPQSLQVTYPKGDTSTAYTMDYAWQPQQTKATRTVFFLPQYGSLSVAGQSGGTSQAGCLAAVNPFGNPDFQRMIANCLGQPQGGGALRVAVQPDGAVDCSTATDHDNVSRLVCQARNPAPSGTVRVVVNYDQTGG